MSEFPRPSSSNRGRIVRLGATLALTTLLSGSSAVTPQVEAASTVVAPDFIDLKRCFTTPRAGHAKVDPAKLPPITLTKGSAGNFQGDPGPLDPKVLDTVKGATIKITNGLQTGSGVLVRTPDGGTVALSAAHVGYDSMAGPTGQNLARMQFTDRRGRTATAKSGCYMYETNGVFDNLESGKANATDLLIVSLAQPIGDGALTLADNAPTRGSWNAAFVNYQDDRPVGNPAVFNGMVLTNADQGGTWHILTGVEPAVNCAPNESGASNCTYDAGGSGGEVVNQEGAVIGIGMSGEHTEYEHYLKNQDLQETYATTIEGPSGPDTPVWPIVAGVVPLSMVREAITAGSWQ